MIMSICQTRDSLIASLMFGTTAACLQGWLCNREESRNDDCFLFPGNMFAC